MPVSINGSGIIGGVSDFSSSNIALTDPEITGGIYLGGTGSDNYLDDYEEGDWTPTADGFTFNLSYGRYVKVGKLVTAHFRINVTSQSSNTTVATINNLPFVSDSLNNYRIGGFISETNYTPTNQLTVYGADSSSSVFLRDLPNNIEYQDLDALFVFGKIIYHTT